MNIDVVLYLILLFYTQKSVNICTMFVVDFMCLSMRKQFLMYQREKFYMQKL